MRAAFDAGAWLFFAQHHLRQRVVAKVNARLKRNCLFWADIGAQTALRTGILLEKQLRQVDIVPQRAGWAERHTGKTDHASLGINQNCAVGRSRQQGQCATLFFFPLN